MQCQKCGLDITDDLLFCEDCGFTPSAPPIVKRLSVKDMLKRRKHYILVIGRSNRSGSGDFDVIVNGGNYGKIKMGKTLTISSDEPDIEIGIKAMGLNPIKTRLKFVDDKAYAEAAVWKKNILLHSISGAESH